MWLHKGGEFLSKKIGRPTNNPKNSVLRLRIDNETLSKLEYCAKILNSNKSETVRKGIEKMYDELKK